jgi:hypothetical protein
MGVGREERCRLLESEAQGANGNCSGTVQLQTILQDLGRVGET